VIAFCCSHHKERQPWPGSLCMLEVTCPTPGKTAPAHLVLHLKLPAFTVPRVGQGPEQSRLPCKLPWTWAMQPRRFLRGGKGCVVWQAASTESQGRFPGCRNQAKSSSAEDSVPFERPPLWLLGSNSDRTWVTHLLTVSVILSCHKAGGFRKQPITGVHLGPAGGAEDEQTSSHLAPSVTLRGCPQPWSSHPWPKQTE
jgi:hypothetical protein